MQLFHADWERRIAGARKDADLNLFAMRFRAASSSGGGTKHHKIRLLYGSSLWPEQCVDADRAMPAGVHSVGPGRREPEDRAGVLRRTDRPHRTAR
jgi:hypothetical protein